MANLNIFGNDWSNIVFEGRNKNYGGYKLRKENTQNTFIALLIGLGIVGSVFLGVFIYKIISGGNSSTEKNDGGIVATVVDLPPLPDPEPPVEEVKEEPKPEPEPEPKPKEPEPEQADASKSVQDEKALTKTEVKKDDEVDQSKLQKTSQNDFDENTTSGRQDREGDREAGDFKADGSQTGGADKGSKGKGTGNEYSEKEVDNKIYNSVSRKAEPEAGMSRWGNNFVREFRTPSNIPGNVKQITIRMQFVVEKDGTVSSVRILGDKYGLAKEAERTLKAIGKWVPAEQNGVKVRSRFTQPITININ